jgi:hypothetical protein
MKHQSSDHGDPTVVMHPSIEVSPSGRPTAEEIERRRIVVERMLARSYRVGPIGTRVDDLLHEARAEAESEN